MLRSSRFACTAVALCAAAWSGSALAQSAKARQKSHLGLAPRYGVMTTLAGGPGAEVFLSLGSRVQLGGTYFASKIDMTESFQESMEKDYDDRLVPESERIETTELTMASTLALGFVRIFVGNSFYLTLGAGQRTIDGAFELRTPDQASSMRGEFETTSTVAAASIGNQWMFDSGIFIGCDWFGLVSPSSSKYESKVETTGVANALLSEEEDDLAELSEKIGQAPTAQMLVLSLGFAL